MLVDRKNLIAHLQHINCGGLLKDAVLEERFKCSGFSVSQDLLVMTTGLEKENPLSQAIGVIGLEMLIKVLDIGDEEKISFDLVDNYLMLQAADRVVKLATASPAVISSRADAHILEKILGKIGGDVKWVPLGLRVVTGVLEAVSKLGAEAVVIYATPKGSRIVVGEEKTNSITFAFPELVSTEDYKVNLSPDLVVPVFKQISDYTKAEVCLTGKDSIVPIREDRFLYVMSPRDEV